MQVNAKEVLGRRAVEDELAEDLAETAADIEEDGAGFDAGEEGGVFGDGGEVEMEEAPAADAGVGEDGPGFVSLGLGSRSVLPGRKGMPSRGVRGCYRVLAGWMRYLSPLREQHRG